MKKLLYLFLLLLPVLGFSQSRYGVEGVPMCWTTALGVDSSIVRYVLVSTTGKPVKTIVYENANGAVVMVSGGTLKYGFCDCAGGGALDSLLNGSVTWPKLANPVKDSINKSVTWARLAAPVKDSIRIGMNPKRDTSINFFGAYNLSTALGDDVIQRRYRKINLSGDGPGNLVVLTLPDGGLNMTDVDIFVTAASDTIQVQAAVNDGIYPKFKKVNPGRVNEYKCLQIGGGVLWKGSVWDSLGVGGGGSLFYDNFRLPGIYRYIPATGLLANESVANYGFASVNSTYYKFSTTALGSASTEYGGWLANGTSGDSIGVDAPFGVIIGDSQAEGHGAGVHGRLHPGGVATFNRTLQDFAGNPSFYLRGLTKMRWFNHGIGGQTTDNIWARWRRDVLAETFDPSDSRGSKTLNRKPAIVIVIAGINDLATLTTRSWTVTASNLELMARSARDNGIHAVFLNCPGDEVITELCARRVDSLNIWMASGALQALGAAVVDYNKWWRDPAYNDNFHGNSLLADDIHPSAVGYDSLMNYTFRAAKLPVLTGIRFRNELSPSGFSGYSRPSSVNIQGVAHTIADEDDTVVFATPLAWDSVSIKINSSVNVTGTTYSGFSHIEWILQNDTIDLATKRPGQYQSFQGGETFARVSNVISPINTSRLLTLGTVTPYSTATLLTVKGALSSGNTIFNVAGASNANIFNILDNGRVVVGGSSIGGFPFGVTGGSAQFQISSTNYTNLNGAAATLYGAPNLIMQSTAVNTGASGYTRTDFTWNGADGLWAPHATFGVNNTWTWRNLAETNTFRINLANQGTSNTVTSLGVIPNVNTGHVLENTTSATSGNQQISPMLRWAGQGWATTPGASRLVDFAAFVTPIQGTSASGYLGFGSGINSSYNYDQFRFHTDGSFSIASTLWLDHAKTIGIFTGSGSPEGVITASPGSTFHNILGGAGVSFYVKESGTGNTGWVAK